MGAEESYGVAGAKSSAPTARSVFTIEKVSDARRGQYDDKIRYGDKFRLLADENIFGIHKKVFSF